MIASIQFDWWTATLLKTWKTLVETNLQIIELLVNVVRCIVDVWKQHRSSEDWCLIKHPKLYNGFTFANKQYISGRLRSAKLPVVLSHFFILLI